MFAGIPVITIFITGRALFLLVECEHLKPIPLNLTPPKTFILIRAFSQHFTFGQIRYLATRNTVFDL